jgi:hypothetical protein
LISKKTADAGQRPATMVTANLEIWQSGKMINFPVKFSGAYYEKTVGEMR